MLKCYLLALCAKNHAFSFFGMSNGAFRKFTKSKLKKTPKMSKNSLEIVKNKVKTSSIRRMAEKWECNDYF